MTATCEQCGTVFAIKPYHLKQGRGRYCSRPCYAKARKAVLSDAERVTRKRLTQQRWRASRLEARREAHKQWRAAHPDYDQNWRDTHRESVRHSEQTSALRHRDVSLVRRRERHRAHPETRIAEYARRQARKRGATRNDLTAAQWKEIKAAYDHRCVYCGKKPQRLTQDHIIPLSKGGENTASNVVPACQSCNSRKGTGAPLVPVQPLLLTVA
jgi:5-methylcytosine-specific restriction endonuclease McrA